MPPHPIVVVAHDIRSAHNVGSVFRTADSAGLAEVVLSGFSPGPDHRGVAKSALGAERAVPWRRFGTLDEVVGQLRRDGYTIAALERVDGAVRPSEVSPGQFPLALILGNEVHGVAPGTLAEADLVVGLPQYGEKASLNVSVAFGVAAYGLVDRAREAAR